MIKIFSAVVTSYILAFLIIPVIISYSKKKNVLDTPDRRKIHKGSIPSLGGIAIFIGFVISTCIWIGLAGIVHYKYVLVALSIIFAMGIRDDVLPIRPKVKLIVQLVAATMVVLLAKSNIQITSLYGLFGVFELNSELSFVLSLFTIIVVTNAFNLIDGLDGLAGVIAIISLIFFGVWFFLIKGIGAPNYTPILIFSMLGAVLAFLSFNWEPAKIFMGDTGALVLGFLFSILAIHFIEVNYHLPMNHTYRFNASITTAVCVIIIPLCDTLRIFIVRLSKGKSPFDPDKSHIHHALMRLGLRHYQTALVLGIVNILFIGVAVVFQDYGDNVLLPVVLVLAILFSMSIDALIKRKVTTVRK
jgi:UDP-N-acetylmuramyl pentapeptide phosphotransferase/UDP-N-acetylglucosamine-1-phosphate transferase